MRLTDDEAARRLDEARVLRLATVDQDGAPHQVPATFVRYAGPRGDRIAIAVDHKPKRHRNLRRLRNIEAEPRVCALVDAYSDDWTRLWWVRADGTARVLYGEGGREGEDGQGSPDGPDREDGQDIPDGPDGGPGSGRREGRGSDASEQVERRAVWDLLAAKYPQYAERRPDGPVIVIDVGKLTGWAYADPVA
ncbi:TIGR03668 family PPOX class F420-dependent oxidoreductase [Streptomyces sp. NPDC047002]|uniref:TIGR03668 family PPOX class F420-dependent oxidoreductase n=1 Tax=Streptomyces sp. NPDC047002 TaxID=3155475 RepID=UPI00345376F1